MDQIDVIVIGFEGDRLLSFKSESGEATDRLGRDRLSRLAETIAARVDPAQFDVDDTVATITVDESTESKIGDITIH